VFLAVGRNAESDDEAAIGDMDTVDQQGHEIEAVERRALPGRELRRRPGDETSADRALARAAACDLRPDRLQTPRVLPRGNADQHLLDNAPVKGVGGRHRCVRGQRNLAGGRPHARR
jgi:hypothetical protein